MARNGPPIIQKVEGAVFSKNFRIDWHGADKPISLEVHIRHWAAAHIRHLHLKDKIKAAIHFSSVGSLNPNVCSAATLTFSYYIQETRMIIIILNGDI